MPSPTGQSRLGIGLTRRHVADAVDRNRLKRVIREAFRVHAVKSAGLDCVVMLRERYAPSQEAALRDEIVGFLDRLGARE
jgi:ribonuclease P protein component